MNCKLSLSGTPDRTSENVSKVFLLVVVGSKLLEDTKGVAATNICIKINSLRFFSQLFIFHV